MLKSPVSELHFSFKVPFLKGSDCFLMDRKMRIIIIIMLEGTPSPKYLTPHDLWYIPASFFNKLRHPLPFQSQFFKFYFENLLSWSFPASNSSLQILLVILFSSSFLKWVFCLPTVCCFFPTKFKACNVCCLLCFNTAWFLLTVHINESFLFFDSLCNKYH